MLKKFLLYEFGGENLLDVYLGKYKGEPIVEDGKTSYYEFKGQVLKWSVLFYVDSVAGTNNPSLTFKLYLDYNGPGINLPAITSPVTYVVSQTRDDEVILLAYDYPHAPSLKQKVTFGKFPDVKGILLEWHVSGTASSFTGSIWLIYEY